MLHVKNQPMNAGRGKTPKTCEPLVGSSRTLMGLGNFVSDRSGAVAIVAAASFFVIMASIAGAVEYARYSTAKTDLRNAVDTAVLAAAREFQRSGDFAAAQQIGSDYLSENTKNIIPLNPVTGQPSNINALINISLTGNGTTISATGSVDIENSLFSGLGKINKAFAATGNNSGKFSGLTRLPLFRGSGADEASATLRVGSDAGRSIEVAMMLDVTGSMGGSKLEDLKTAAKTFIDTVIWDDQSEFTSRVALVPFSEAVNTTKLDFNNVMRSKNSGSDKNSKKGNSSSHNLHNRWGSDVTVYRQDKCIVERTGSEAFTDATPSSQADRFPRYYSRHSYCNASADMIPLSSNKSNLKSQINNLTAGGYTAGHIGTAWSWYMLSPNFASVLGNGSEPAAYPDPSTPVKERDVVKYAILMTDGEYNQQYCGGSDPISYSGMADRYSGNGPNDCNAANGSSVNQARTLCTNMKAQGIIVYSIGFKLRNGGTAEQTMNHCASSPDHSFDVNNGDQLQQAYADIAVQIAQLYLSK
ncbi:MAG: pilus assembly protein TadG-related protein [Hyphomicrobiaceae bacterium]